MLPEMHLDDESYKKIIDDARNKIVSIYPGWTDFNYHDPGITLIELLAWIKESQQYFLDQIGDENQKKYLKLLGMHIRHKQMAEAIVTFHTDRGQYIPQGSRCQAEEVCFELPESKRLIAGDIKCCLSMKQDQILDYVDRGQMEFVDQIHFKPFGEDGKKGNCCYIGLDEGIVVGEEYSVYLEVFHEYPVKRNKIEEDMEVQLADLEISVYAQGEWKAAMIAEDETYGMLQSGFLTLVSEDAMSQTTIAGETAYFIRIEIKAAEYDVAPVLTEISMNKTRVYQGRSMITNEFYSLDEIDVTDGMAQLYVNSYLAAQQQYMVYEKYEDKYLPHEDFIIEELPEEEGGILLEVELERPDTLEGILLVMYDEGVTDQMEPWYGSGFPYQEISLERGDLSYEDMEILVQDIEDEKVYVRWDKVEDFAASGPSDHHYVFDSSRGVLIFGDCIHGMAPEGEIVITSLRQTQGAGGNVKAGRINSFYEDVEVSNKENAVNGADEESVDDCILRVRRQLKDIECAVSFTDFEQRVQKTPGLMVESCKAVSGSEMQEFGYEFASNVTYMVVKPYSKERFPKLSTRYLDNLSAYIENYRMVGSKIRFLNAEYVGVTVYIDVAVNPQYLNSKQLLEDAIAVFFEQFDESFGEVVEYGKLYAMIDRLPYVTGIYSMSLDANGSNVDRNEEWDILLAPNASVALEDIKSSLFMEG